MTMNHRELAVYSDQLKKEYMSTVMWWYLWWKITSLLIITWFITWFHFRWLTSARIWEAVSAGGWRRCRRALGLWTARTAMPKSPILGRWLWNWKNVRMNQPKPNSTSRGRYTKVRVYSFFPSKRKQGSSCGNKTLQHLVTVWWNVDIFLDTDKFECIWHGEL